MDNEAQDTGTVGEKRTEDAPSHDGDSERVDTFTQRPKPTDIIEFHHRRFEALSYHRFYKKIESARKDTDAAIDRRDYCMLAEGAVRLVNLAVANKTDTIFFLDRSGRPGAYLFLTLWREMYPEFKPPHIKFIDIGTNTSNLLSESLHDGLVNELRRMYGNLRGHRCIVADEVISSGSTMLKAKSIMSQIYPNNHFIYTAMFDQKTPEWYYSKNYSGILGVSSPSGGSLIAEVADENREKEVRERMHQFRGELTALAETVAEFSQLKPRGAKDVIKPLLASATGSDSSRIASINEST